MDDNASSTRRVQQQPAVFVKRSAHQTMEIGDGRHDPDTVCLTVYVPDKLDRWFQLDVDIMEGLMDGHKLKRLVLDLDFDGATDLLMQMGVRETRPTPEQLLAYAALNVALQNAIGDGLPVGVPLLVVEPLTPPGARFVPDLSCSGVGVDEAFRALARAAEGDATLLRRMTDDATSLVDVRYQERLRRFAEEVAACKRGG